MSETGARRRVLVLCTANSARSQMAEGLIRHAYGDRIEVFSAGTMGTSVRPEAIASLAEVGIDISGHRSKSFDEFRDQVFDDVITVCDSAAERCPVFPGRGRRIHRGFRDPASVHGTDEERLDAFRRTRDALREWLRELYGNDTAGAPRGARGRPR